MRLALLTFFSILSLSSAAPVILGDDFASPIELGTTSERTIGLNAALASAQEGEPTTDQDDGRSLWLTFTPAEDGTHYLYPDGLFPFGVLQLFEGDEITNLLLLDEFENQVDIIYLKADLTAGTEYRIRFSAPLNTPQPSLDNDFGDVLDDDFFPSEEIESPFEDVEATLGLTISRQLPEVRTQSFSGDRPPFVTYMLDGSRQIRFTTAAPRQLDVQLLTFGFVNETTDDNSDGSFDPGPGVELGSYRIEGEPSSEMSLVNESPTSGIANFEVDLEANQTLLITIDPAPEGDHFGGKLAFFDQSEPDLGEALLNGWATVDSSDGDRFISTALSGLSPGSYLLELSAFDSFSELTVCIDTELGFFALDEGATRSPSLLGDNISSYLFEVGSQEIARVFFEHVDSDFAARLIPLGNSSSSSQARAAQQLLDNEFTTSELQSTEDALRSLIQGSQPNAAAALLVALIDLVQVPLDPSVQTELEDLGLVIETDDEGGVPSLSVPTDESGDRMIQDGLRTASLFDMVDQRVVENIERAKTFLAAFCSSSVQGEIPGRGVPIAIDKADLAAVSVGLDVLLFIHDLARTFNLDLDVQILQAVNDGEEINLSNILGENQDLLTVLNSNGFAELKERIDLIATNYCKAVELATSSDSFRNSNLFSPGRNVETALVLEGQQSLADLDTDLSTPTEVRVVPRRSTVLNPAAWCEETPSLRSLLPQLRDSKAIAFTEPDPTLAGLFPDADSALFAAALREANLLIEAAGYSEFIARFFAQAEEFRFFDNAPTDDFDGDGATNEAEYFFGSNPVQRNEVFAAPVASLTPRNGRPQVCVSFVRKIDQSDVRYIVAISEDLQTYDFTNARVEECATPDPVGDGRYEVAHFRIFTTTPLPENAFVRIYAIAN